MNAIENNTTIVSGYAGLLQNLSMANKLDLIAQLTASVKSDLDSKPSYFKQAYGAFETEKTAEAMIEEIRNSRVSNRQIEAF